MLPSKNEMLSMYNKVSSRVKQYALSMTPLELKVDEATNNEPWGPHGTVMAEISRASFDYENYKQIMGVVARRLQSDGENWRHAYKSLLLLEYMTKHGPQKVADELSSNIGVIERLQRFEYTDKNGKDWGLNVRQRAKELSSLISDPDRIKRERQKAKTNESKYTGVSSIESRSGLGFGSSSSSSFGGGSSFAGGSALGGGSALTSAGGGGGGGGGRKGFGSSGGGFGSAGGFGSSSGLGGGGRYDDDFEAGHSALNADDPDDDFGDVKEATKKRIDSLKKKGQSDASEGRSSPRRINKAQAAAAEAESRGPKKLSQVKVNPNIAMSLGVSSKAAGPAASASQPSAAAAGPAAPSMLDLFADDPAPPPPAAPAPQTRDSTWDAFSGAPSASAAPAAAPKDDWGDLLQDGPATAAAHDPFAALTAQPPQQGAAPAAAPAPPSGLGGAADPFATWPPASQAKATGPMPMAPAPQRADTDPFATLSTAADPFAPAKPNSPLRAAGSPAASMAARTDPFSTDRFAPAPADGSPLNPAQAAAARNANALPEDMFSAPAAAPAHVRVGTAPAAGSPSWGVGARDSPARGSQPGSATAFGSFSAAPRGPAASQGTDMFGSFGASPKKGPGVGPEALGGGMKMAPNAPQPNLPPPVIKQDPFAGLAGF